VKATKRENLERSGWKLGSAQDFLELTDEEAAYIELKLALGAELRVARAERHCTQAELARLMGSSQSRVAKMEAADPAVSIDLLVRALLALGRSSRQIGQTIARASQDVA
jgi:DNA-binding XRE family transcriptional regulator